jgi:hypothetical protein
VYVSARCLQRKGESHGTYHVGSEDTVEPLKTEVTMAFNTVA